MAIAATGTGTMPRAMNGSGATAWSPPVIYTINGVDPNIGEDQWPAGTTTPVRIVGAGFGYSPGLTITGNGITGYSNAYDSSPSLSCDTQIIATVTIAANTPANSQENITVTAGGQNPSGYLPVRDRTNTPCSCSLRIEHPVSSLTRTSCP